MFKSKMDRFLLTREALFFVPMAATAVAFMGRNRWTTLCGLFAGALFVTGRLAINEWILMKTFRLDGKRAAAWRIAVLSVSQLVWGPAFVLAYFLNIWVLYGFVAGALLLPLIIMLNSITEAFGITENHFEQGVQKWTLPRP